METLKNCFLTLFIVFSLFLSGCVSAPPVQSTTENLAELAKSMGVGFSYDPVTRSALLFKNESRVHALVGSDVVVMGNDRILLNAPVTIKGDDVFVSQDFREKVLSRMDQSVSVEKVRKGGLRIVIDPGHGGKDSGAVGNHLKEKDIVLDISRRLERILKDSGYDVKMTRSSDIFISLEGRTESAAEWNADIFISIHANSSESYRADGFEIWAPRDLTHEDFAESQRRKNEKILFKQMKMRQNNSALEKTLNDMIYNYKHDRSAVLASIISKNCTKSVGIGNRGVKQSGFFVLRNTLVPSVLAEVGFISNRNEAEKLRSSSFRQEIAEMLAEGIKEYHRGL
ncbi:MAG: N-acetylmuramoyl-L-alanine amidase [Candidatus Omnitrophota bacterium]